MLPRIVVATDVARPEILKTIGLSENYIMSFEGREAKVSDFRHWINTSVNIAGSRPLLSLLVWDADELSNECQAVLLKPMEELSGGITLVLIVQNENRLSPTILSRGVLEHYVLEKKEVESQWSEVRKCWSSGPSACIAFTDQLNKESAIQLLDEVVIKLRAGLTSEVNRKRLDILDLAVNCLYELKQTNINHKLSLDNFLICSWRMIKA